jgi:hypothetical protein
MLCSSLLASWNLFGFAWFDFSHISCELYPYGVITETRDCSLCSVLIQCNGEFSLEIEENTMLNFNVLLLKLNFKNKFKKKYNLFKKICYKMALSHNKWERAILLNAIKLLVDIVF